MPATPMIHDLVREGRVSPRDGALLIELRRDVAKHRERKLRPQNAFVRIAVGIGVLILAVLGVRRYQ
jgi:hypothetical protein